MALWHHPIPPGHFENDNAVTSDRFRSVSAKYLFQWNFPFPPHVGPATNGRFRDGDESCKNRRITANTRRNVSAWRNRDQSNIGRRCCGSQRLGASARSKPRSDGTRAHKTDRDTCNNLDLTQQQQNVYLCHCTLYRLAVQAAARSDGSWFPARFAERRIGRGSFR